MQEGKFSRTAQRVAIRRAAHQLLDDPRVLDDPLALRIIGAEAVGKYAIKFSWNDGHDLGIYSWRLLREMCPCEQCKAAPEIQN